MYTSGIKNRSRILEILLLILLVVTGCSTRQKINKMINRSAVLQKHHVGFALYDLSDAKMVYEKDAGLYYTPASNTKLLTFYGALKMISDSLPGLRYQERGDSLIFWGTGDPSLLQSSLKSDRIVNFLKSTSKQLFFSPNRYTGVGYGRGWQWDDYNDDYQAEINELPIMDNLLHLSIVDGSWKVRPLLFKDCIFKDSLALDTTFKVKRIFDANIFTYPSVAIPKQYIQRIPYKLSIGNTLSILTEVIEKPITILNRLMPKEAQVIYSEKRDSVLKEMMLPSDNFIAEQLLLVCADRQGLEMNTEKVIDFIKHQYLSGLPDETIWVDGSGLSRYNLNTPRNLTGLLAMIYRDFKNPGQLFGMLAAGGVSGTLKNAYRKTSKPFVYGKTGTLSNNHSQSGYVVTKRNKTYAFSFMNNNFVVPTSTVRKEIEQIITYVHEQL